MLTAVLRLWGQEAGGPKGVDAQSMARMSAPISPPPARKAFTSSRGGCVIGMGKALQGASMPQAALAGQCPGARK